MPVACVVDGFELPRFEPGLHLLGGASAASNLTELTERRKAQLADRRTGPRPVAGSPGLKQRKGSVPVTMGSFLCSPSQYLCPV